ncbi:MAG: DUF2637 domain-containing protein [Mycolicibacterium sp.]|nr:DUF2637 domain-containing protein [Mycolicibacterium sp.]
MTETTTHSGPRRHWAGVLTAAVLVSVAGNVGHAILTAPEHLRVPAAVAAALPPIALLAVTEGLARSHGHGVRRRVYRAGVAGGVMIAALAFVLSFAALRDLAIALGQPAAVAAGWPLLADATIAVASVMLLAMKPEAVVATRPAIGGQHPVAVPVADADPEPAVAAPMAAVATPVASPVAGGHLVAITGQTSGDASEDQHRDRAAELVEAGVVRAPVATVATALAGLATGDSHRSVAAATGLHRVTVAKLAEVG